MSVLRKAGLSRWARRWPEMTENPDTAALATEHLDRLMPMHLLLSETGHIRHAGPTLAKLFPGNDLVGRRFLEVLELRRPRSIDTLADLRRVGRVPLHLRFRDPPHTGFRGVAAPMSGSDGLLVNLSFGIAVADAVRDHHLTNADFAATDLTVEMLYLIEAKTAVMNESRNLNLRLQGARIAAEEQAFTDTLTGLKNRRAMDHILARLIGSGAWFALMQLDLDYFKAVNDTFGHAAGDHVLQVVARILVEETREADTAARVGGDEFVLVFDRLVDPDRLRGIAERIIERLEEPVRFEGQTCQISGSVGIVMSTLYGDPEVETMLADADAALYASKHKGRACVTFATEIEGWGGDQSSGGKMSA